MLLLRHLVPMRLLAAGMMWLVEGMWSCKYRPSATRAASSALSIPSHLPSAQKRVVPADDPLYRTCQEIVYIVIDSLNVAGH